MYQAICKHVCSNLEQLTNIILDATGLEEAFMEINKIRFLGDFYSYQIISDMVEIGLLKSG